MPRELKKRGRREEAKRKRNGENENSSTKRQRLEEHADEVVVSGDAGDDFIKFELESEINPSEQPNQPNQPQFYGLLDEDEQQYYASVNSKISANDFESDEDRTNFIDAVHRESKGKEIKIASSQSCSRYLERVMQLSTREQLQSVFAAFLQDLNYLVQHRFGSHCCETLFLQAARYVQPNNDLPEDQDDVETLFVKAAEQLKPNIGYLLTERFASHTVRVLLLVLSGESLDDSSLQRVLASRKKEHIDQSQLPENSQIHADHPVRRIPAALKKSMISLIETAVSSLDTTYLRALVTHPTGNPMLQLLLRLELDMSNNSKIKQEGTLFKKLLPDDDFDPDSESVKFLSGLVYDSTGSHLVEVLVQHLPGKVFKKLYKNMFKERMGRLARNDIAGYVVVRILHRIGKDDLAEAQQQILKEVPSMLERHRLIVIRALVERCEVRQIDATPLAHAFKEAIAGTDAATPESILTRLLQWNPQVERGDEAGEDHVSLDKQQQHSSSSRSDLQGSLLAQAMLREAATSELIQASILAQSDASLIQLCKDPVSSRVLQVALTVPTVSNKFRRQLIPRLYGRVAELAIDAAGSHVVDALWEATKDLHFMKERLAQELRRHEQQVRESRYGRTVWKNWAMDTYMRRPREWQAIAKGLDDSTPQENAEDGQTGAGSGSGSKQKSAIQLARERHVQKQARNMKSQDRTGGNATPVVSANA